MCGLRWCRLRGRRRRHRRSGRPIFGTDLSIQLAWLLLAFVERVDISEAIPGGEVVEERAVLTDKMIDYVQRSHAVRVEDLDWAYPDHTWSQILAVVEQLSQSKQIKLVCRRHGGLVIIPPIFRSQVLECPLPAMSSGIAARTVRYATLAPSSHNTQCRKFALDDRKISIPPYLSR